MQLKFGASLFAVAATVWSAVGLAQATAATGADAGAPVQADNGLTEVVISAQRREESLQSAAVAVNVVSEAELINRGVNSAQDLTKLVPALRINSDSAGASTIVIRGVGSFSGNPYGEPGVAFNMDGVYLPRNGGPNGLFYDLQRVEVLKGPQGTLYGRNATAGAINVITRKPTQEYSAEGTLDVGDYDYRRGTLALNAPLGENAAVRVAGSVSRRDGYFKDGYYDDHTDAVRGTLKLAPTSDLLILLTADYQSVDSKGLNGVISPFLNPNDPYLGSTRDGTNEILRNASLGISGGANPDLLPQVGTDGFVKLENRGVSATIEQDLGFAELTVVPSYRKSDTNALHYGAAFPVRTFEHSIARSLEARLASKQSDGPLQWLLGSYYFGENLNFDLFANQGVAFNRTIPDLQTRGYAGFGQITFALNDTFRLIGGARYNEEHKSQEGLNGGPTPSVPAGFPGSAEDFYNSACAPYDAASGTCFAPLDGKLNQNKVTWKAGFEWDAGASSLLYANVSTGFKAGGFYGSLAPNTYRPETLTAYTVGSKNRFWGNTLQLNMEAFYWLYDDKQVTHLGPIRPAGFNLITENAGKADIYGADLDLLWQPTRHDQFGVSAQYLHTRYKTFQYFQSTVTGVPQTACTTNPVAGEQAVVVDCSGRPLSKSPEWTVNLSYDRKFDLSNGSLIDAMIGTRIESSSWLNEEYLAGEYQKSNMISNASLTWHSGDARFSLSAFVENIENTAVRTTAFVQPVLGVAVDQLSPPRTYGVRVGFNF